MKLDAEKVGQQYVALVLVRNENELWLYMIMDLQWWFDLEALGCCLAANDNILFGHWQQKHCILNHEDMKLERHHFSKWSQHSNSPLSCMQVFLLLLLQVL